MKHGRLDANVLLVIMGASAIGDAEARLPHAFVASAAVMALFACFLFLTPWGRRLGRATANASS